MRQSTAGVPDNVNIHGTAVAVAGRAVLIRGRPGAGKSDLALRCLAVPAGPFAIEPPRLVADDRVLVELGPDGLNVSAPAALRGLLEVRGVGIVSVASTERAILTLVADIAETGTIERLPQPGATSTICGVEVPLVAIAPFEASAPLKLLLALAEAIRDNRT